MGRASPRARHDHVLDVEGHHESLTFTIRRRPKRRAVTSEQKVVQMRIFVAGARGVRGSRLVPLLAEGGHEVAGDDTFAREG